IAEEVFGDSDMEDYLSTKPIRNIPILTGLKYQSEVGSMEIYGMAQIGINLFKIGDWEMEDFYYEGYPIDLMKFEFDGGSTFGFAVGAGLIFNQSFTLSARYFSLGEAELDTTVDVNGDSIPWEDLPDKKISMFVITAGINF
ncbi:MAG: hypothetical protein JXR51_08130, partial [Bacteroidales bacterium]|nr:hypothetical protein [Bacteroidales bacterium]